MMSYKHLHSALNGGDKIRKNSSYEESPQGSYEEKKIQKPKKALFDMFSRHLIDAPVVSGNTREDDDSYSNHLSKL